MTNSIDKKLLKKFGMHVQKIRLQKNMSLREVSYACNIDNSKISKIERGGINITFMTIIQLAKALNVEPKELLDFQDE